MRTLIFPEFLVFLGKKYKTWNLSLALPINVPHDFQESSNFTSILFPLKAPSPWTQDINWTYIRRLQDILDLFWTSYVRSIYDLCPEVENIMFCDIFKVSRSKVNPLKFIYVPSYICRRSPIPWLPFLNPEKVNSETTFWSLSKCNYCNYQTLNTIPQCPSDFKKTVLLSIKLWYCSN